MITLAEAMQLQLHPTQAYTQECETCAAHKKGAVMLTRKGALRVLFFLECGHAERLCTVDEDGNTDYVWKPEPIEPAAETYIRLIVPEGMWIKK